MTTAADYRFKGQIVRFTNDIDFVAKANIECMKWRIFDLIDAITEGYAVHALGEACIGVFRRKSNHN